MMKKIFSDGRSELSSAVAAEQVAGNEDLVREILLRLPVRSLIRFKSVSKQWSSLISDPHFARDHTHRINPSSSIPSALFFYNSLTMSQEIESVSLQDAPNRRSRVGIRVPSLSFLDPAAAGAKIKVLQSCNGLLLCLFTSQSSGSEVKSYCVCNPSTKNYTILPQPSLIPPENINDFRLAFDPSESLHYKVVCVKSFGLFDRIRKFEIYSSENGIWRATGCSIDPPWGMRFDRGIYWNGAIHWIDIGSIRNYIVQFNINAENSKLILMPPKPQSHCDQTLRFFGECRGHLHLIYVRSRSAQLFHVLEKDRDTFKWNVKYRVHISRFITPFPEIIRKAGGGFAECYKGVEYAFSILHVVKGDKEEDSQLVLTIPGKVISYNFHHKTTKVLCMLPSLVVDTSCYNYVAGFHYIETLSSV